MATLHSATPVATYPRLASMALHHIAVYQSLYSEGELVDMIGAMSMTMDTLEDAHDAHDAILHNLEAGLLHQAPCGGLTVTPAGIAAMREGGPYPRHLADGAIIQG